MLGTGRIIGLGLAIWLGMGGAALAIDPIVDEKDIPGEFSANVALTTEYIFRGISQTDGSPAIQGGFDYSATFIEQAGPFKDFGAYLGVWGSNVNFTDANIEIDTYGGFTAKLFGVGLDAGVIWYAYPGAASDLDYDFFEVKFAASYDFFDLFSATAGVNYSPDYFGSSGTAWYPALDIEVPIGKYLALTAHVGYQSIDDNAAFGTDDYLDYGVGATVNLWGFDFTLGWTDTDLDSSQCDDLCGIVTFTASRSF